MKLWTFYGIVHVIVALAGTAVLCALQDKNPYSHKKFCMVPGRQYLSGTGNRMDNVLRTVRYGRKSGMVSGIYNTGAVLCQVYDTHGATAAYRPWQLKYFKDY